MRGGFESSISAIRVMQVFESRQLWPREASLCEYLNISNIFLIFEHA